jgi:predicted 2-oxoglutarate/Fe(II)-dependent dioxygenase YbiX
MCADFQINTQNYLHLPEFLDKTNCQELTTVLRNFVEAGRTIKDDQCPLSDAVHGAPEFDSLLEQLLPHFETTTGKKLHPTYAYARMYRSGEVLKPHTDRSACEISATITLDFAGDVWPIFMADRSTDPQATKLVMNDGVEQPVKNIQKVLMGVGDAVLYSGMEKIHWREAYTGEWQAQVFLHYVDADGPYADQKFDKRKSLSHQKNVPINFWSFADALSFPACDKLVESAETNPTELAGIGGDVGTFDKKIRDVKRIQLPSYRGIGATLAGMGLAANVQAWKFDISHANQCDFLKYDQDGHYLAHVDTFLPMTNEPLPTDCRKLTVLAFLNDDFEGGRLFIQDGCEKIYPPQTKGSVLVFPSFILHGVEPVTKGIRRSVVTWMVGPWFK